MTRERLLAGRTVVAVGIALVAMTGCAHLRAHDDARAQAHASGKYKVRLTTEGEGVKGTCKFVGTIQPNYDPTNVPTNAQLPDYFREEAVLIGADTVLVDGRIGEAYICGPGPLNPDGTPQNLPK